MAIAEKQDNELASKKYGLVWDSERELSNSEFQAINFEINFVSKLQTKNLKFMDFWRELARVVLGLKKAVCLVSVFLKQTNKRR